METFSNIKRAVVEENINFTVSYNKHDYGFKIDELNFYKNINNQLIEDGYIKSGVFDDVHWILLDKDNTMRRTHLYFDLEVHRDLNLALKCFALLYLKAGMTHGPIQKTINTLKETFMKSSSFDEDYFSDYEDILLTYSPRKREEVIKSNIHFAEFYSDHTTIRYLNLFKNCPLDKRNVRKLPKYENVLIFDYVLNSYMENCSLGERKKYLPLLLWWMITTVIPLRPVEFLALKSNCTFYKKDNYWLTVPRKKQRGKSSKLEVTNTLKVTKEIFDLVQEYLNLQTEVEKGSYLMSYYSYNSLIEKASSRNVAISRRLRLDKVDIGQMREVINDFYELIVTEKYGYKDIQRVKLGDTRHFAFCNMMLQGFNMLSIARIGGHLNLQSQVSYSRHLDYFAEARIKVLSEQIKRNREKDIGETYLSDMNELIVRSKIKFKQNEGFKIQNGDCYDEEFPSNCIDDCIDCSFHELDLKSNPNIIKELRERSSRLQLNIQEQINTMQRVSKAMFYDVENLQYSHEEQERLFSLANKLNRLFNKKAVVDCYLKDDHKENELDV